jgi:hypothetical protein
MYMLLFGVIPLVLWSVEFHIVCFFYFPFGVFILFCFLVFVSLSDINYTYFILVALWYG